MEKLKDFFLNKSVKVILTYIFLIGIITGIFFSFTNDFYAKDKYTDNYEFQTTTDFSDSYQFLIEVDSIDGVDNPIDEIAELYQSNLNYLGFQNAEISISGENQF